MTKAELVDYIILKLDKRREKCADIASDERNIEVAEYYRGKQCAYDEAIELLAETLIIEKAH